MSSVEQAQVIPRELVLGVQLNTRVPEADQKRQRLEVEDILRRLRTQAGVILADEVGMGKTFVALAIAYSFAVRKKSGPVILMVPANLIDKWEQDLTTFCDLYLDGRQPINLDGASRKDLRSPMALRYGIARHSIDIMKLLDDPPRERCHVIFLAQGAMSRNQADKWVRLALIAEALRRHARGKARKLIQVRTQIHRFLAELIWAIGEERSHDWGDELWSQLLRTDPQTWKETYNHALRPGRRPLVDDPVPKAVMRAVRRVELKDLALALEEMPLRARGGGERVTQRITTARGTLLKVEKKLWNEVLAHTSWRSPLLILDQAHHLKNPRTSLPRQLQSVDSDRDLRTGDGAMVNAFDRMLFLTATPFQLGHNELVRVMERFGDVRWNENELGDRDVFRDGLASLGNYLTESQRASIALQRSWSRLRPEDIDEGADLESWWKDLRTSSRESLTGHQRAVVDAYETAKRSRDYAEKALQPWIVRHNKGNYWVGTEILRRRRIEGGAVSNADGSGGLPVPSRQLLPFFLAARSVGGQSKDLLGEALCSSYEAFRYTRQNHNLAKDEINNIQANVIDLSHSGWYLKEFDRSLEVASGAAHPKISATVQKAVDLWEAGEKVLVFAFYRHTCRALRIHISDEIERRLENRARQSLSERGVDSDAATIANVIDKIQTRFFDDVDGRGRRALDRELQKVVRNSSYSGDLSVEDQESLISALRRYLRVSSTLIRCFPIADFERMKPADAAIRMLDHEDGAAGSWRKRFEGFIEFIATQGAERDLYLDAAIKTETGRIGVRDDEDEANDAHRGKLTLANVQVATGTTKRETRARLMRVFNTPFFPEIFVCSEVMGEGVDLQRFCRHVIHHDLAWNPSNIEQRTGRIDRLGCKAEGRESIYVYLPYLAGTSDERQFRVMSDRERWFRVVMGQDEVARLITPESETSVQLPQAISQDLSFDLEIPV